MLTFKRQSITNIKIQSAIICATTHWRFLLTKYDIRVVESYEIIYISKNGIVLIDWRNFRSSDSKAVRENRLNYWGAVIN